MPEHEISLVLKFDVGDPIKHQLYGPGVVWHWTIEGREAHGKRSVKVLYYVNFADPGSEFPVCHNCSESEIEPQ
jgi:hypothetical protein